MNDAFLLMFRNDAFVVTGEYSADIPYPHKHIGDFEISKLLIEN